MLLEAGVKANFYRKEEMKSDKFDEKTSATVIRDNFYYHKQRFYINYMPPKSENKHNKLHSCIENNQKDSLIILLYKTVNYVVCPLRSLNY